MIVGLTSIQMILLILLEEIKMLWKFYQKQFQTENAHKTFEGELRETIKRNQNDKLRNKIQRDMTWSLKVL